MDEISLAVGYRSWPRSLIGTFGVLLGHGLSLAVLTAVMVQAVPLFTKLFADFGTALPAPTVFVIRLSNDFVRYYYLLIPLLIVDVGIYLMLSRLKIKHDWLVSLWASLTPITCLLLMGFVVLAVTMPMSYMKLQPPAPPASSATTDG